MALKEIKQGQIIFEKGQKISTLDLIMKGSASAAYSGGRFFLHSGDVIGLCELTSDTAHMEYRAEENVTILEFPVENGKLAGVIGGNSEAVRYFLSSAFKQIKDALEQYKLLKVECRSLYDYLVSSYEDYTALCGRYNVSPGEPAEYEELSTLVLEEDIPAWMGGYYSALEQMMGADGGRDKDFICGFLTKASLDMQDSMTLCNEMQDYKADICRFMINENGLDLLELLAALYARAAKRDGLEADDVISIRRNLNDVLIQLENQGFKEDVLYKERRRKYEKLFAQIEAMCALPEEKDQADNEVMEELKGSLDKILAYAACDSELAASFKEKIEQYKGTANKSGTEEDVRLLRQRITKDFYRVYTAAFENSLTDGVIPPVVKMFFNFGYVDEELAGKQNALYLYSIVENLPTAPDQGVYSYYEWLMAVYEGRKEPCRNEFDLDYTAYLIEQKRMGKITPQQEAALQKDNLAKVRYELENVFPMINKVTFGRISTFCPVFSEHNVMKPADTILVTAEELGMIVDNIRQKDYGAYYRETLFSAPDQGVSKEFIHVEVLPDFILTPNVGTRGVMWQEIEGKRRTTPARMMCSIFQLEELALILIRLTGEFRWEMCKRMQGARWNDVSERSLTSEYFDYIQFYRKNNDLSSDAKDKIKADMGRAKNSFKEMFILDYITWILYESNGSPRLNKVARGILFEYCTFTASIREKLKANPLYRELAERYDVHQGQKRHRMENLCQKLRSLGKRIPDEIEKEKEFLYM